MMQPRASELGKLEDCKSDPLKPVTAVRFMVAKMLPVAHGFAKCIRTVPRGTGAYGPGFRTMGCFAVTHGDGLRRRRL